METPYFLDKFEKSVDQIERNLFSLYEMDYRIGVWLKSVAFSFESKWPNVSLNFGPLTLMEGWVGTEK